MMQAAGAEGMQPTVVLERMPAALEDPLDRFEHLIGQLTHARGAFVAKAIEHEARLARFDDEALELAFPAEAYDAVLENQQALEDTLLEVIGHPVRLNLRVIDRDDPTFDAQTLYGRRQARLEAARNARKHAARTDPAITRLVEQLGAEIVELVVDPSSH
jgi:hypothetical protein